MESEDVTGLTERQGFSPKHPALARWRDYNTVEEECQVRSSSFNGVISGLPDELWEVKHKNTFKHFVHHEDTGRLAALTV